jgi:hypothetical protein
MDDCKLKSVYCKLQIEDKGFAHSSLIQPQLVRLADLSATRRVDGVNLKELKSIVAGGESERVEFKRSTGQRSEVAKTVCALANGLGGFVLFGVTNTGEIVGQQVATSPLEDVANEVRRIQSS